MYVILEFEPNQGVRLHHVGEHGAPSLDKIRLLAAPVHVI